MTTPTPSPPAGGRKSVLFLLAVAGLLVLLLAVELGWRTGRQAAIRPLTGDATWIWAPDVATRTEPVAFYAVRDFSLADGDSELELLLAVDEEYLLWVNGVLLGAGALQGDGRLDRWTVPAALLREGPNRVALEARSRRGAGGLLAIARQGDGSIFASGDGSWRLFSSHRPGIVEGWTPVELGVVSIRWQSPPTGRWRVGQPPRDRVASAGPASEDSVRWARKIEEVQTRLVGAGPDGEDVREPSTLIDFGTTLRGQLELWLDADPDVAYRFDVATDDPPLGEVDEPLLEHRVARPGTAVVVSMAQRSWWRDVQVRQLRWVRIRGAEVKAARVIPAAGAEPGPAVEPTGLLGIHSRPESSPGDQAPTVSDRRR